MKRLLLLTTCLATALPAAGQTRLDDIVSAADWTPVEAVRTGGAIEVITREELDAAGDARLIDILARVPGVSVANGGTGNTTIAMRGAYQQFITVLVDGVEVSDPAQSNTVADLSTFLAGDIEQIEILRGSQSTIHGAKAIGGIISITTRRPRAMGTEVFASMEAGAFGTAELAAGFTALGERGDLSFSARTYQTDGFSQYTGGTEADGRTFSSLSLSGGYAISDALTLGATLFHENDYIEYDENGADADNTSDRVRTGGRLSLDIEAPGSAWTHSLFAEGYLSDRTEEGENGAEYEGARGHAGYIGSVDLGRTGLVFGTEFTSESALNQTAFSDVDDTVEVATVLGEVSVDLTERWLVSFGGRIDDHSIFGQYDSLRFATSFRASETLRFRASAGTGYRAPSLAELLDERNGNPDLEPEESVSYDFGVDYTRDFDTRSVALSATAFSIATDNLIGFGFIPADPADPDDFDRFPSVQIPGETTRQGIELGLSIDWARSGIGFGYTLTETERPDGQQLVRVPEQEISLSGYVQATERLRLDATAYMPLDMIDQDFTACDPVTFACPFVDLGGYVLLDVQARYALSDEVTARLRIENLLDEDYQNIATYATPGRSAYLGVSARF
ncbi:MAG: TonB-dependent receptor plug domain-containing protein [Rubricella sp.]